VELGAEGIGCRGRGRIAGVGGAVHLSRGGATADGKEVPGLRSRRGHTGRGRAGRPTGRGRRRRASSCGRPWDGA